MITYSFEGAGLFAGTIGALVGTAAGAAFKESRRGINEERPKGFILPYIIGGAISCAFAALMSNFVS